MSRLRVRPLLVAGALAAIALVVAIVYLLTREGGSADTATVTRGSLEVTIETVGRIRARDPLVVRSGIDGTIETVAVRPGDQVQSGDVLATLDRTPVEDAIELAELQVADAETALSLAEERGGDNPTAEQTAERLAAAQRLRTARQALEQSRERLAATMILAPRAGTVSEVPVAEKARVPAGAPIATVLDLTDLELSVEIDEIDLPRISPGMTAEFDLDAYPGVDLTGTIVAVSPVAQTTGGTTTFPTTIRFEAPGDLALRPGMNANVEIQTAVRQNVLLLPERALRTVGRRTFVTVVRNGAREEREIEIGLRGDGQVEVAQGLTEGERVVLR